VASSVSLMGTPSTPRAEQYYDEDAYQEGVKSDLNFQTFLKMHIFAANEENFVCIFRCTYIKFGANMDTESLIYVVLSSASIYFLKKDRPTDDYAVAFKQPLSRLRRVVIGLFYQFFRLEIDSSPTPSSSPSNTSNIISYVFLPRSHYRAHKFVEALMSTSRACPDALDPPELNQTLLETLYNLKVSLMLSASDVQLYVMLHFRSKFHKGLIPRSLIFSRERLYLCSEDYSKWPLPAGNGGTQFEGDAERQARREQIKSWRTSMSNTKGASQFEVRFTRDMRDVKELQIGGAGTCDVTILFEDEQETGGSKENKNKPREWELVPSHPNEQQRIVKMLSSLWKNLFRIDLPIETKT